MLRLPVLLLTTMAGIFAVMMIWGEGDLRADRRPAPEPTPAVIAAEPEPIQDIAAADPAVPGDVPPDAALSPAPEAATEPAPDTVAETAGGIERFAGPALEPSPEFTIPEAAGPAGDASLWVTANRLNMRAGPSSGDAVVTALDGGTGLVPVGPTGGEWVEVRAPSGQTGFVSSQFVSATPPQ